MSTTDTPRADACPYCGDKRDSKKFYKYECGTLDKYPKGTTRTELCHQTEVSNLWQKRAERAEAEVERLKEALASIEEYGTKEINEAIKLRQELVQTRGEVEQMIELNKGAVSRIHKAKAEVERLRESLKKALEIAEMIHWTPDDEFDPPVLWHESVRPALRAEVEKLKAILN